mgnify:CR=1 FL=1
MEVTEIRIFLSEEERLRAYVTVTFDNCFVVRDLKVINGNTGLFVAMPSKKKKDGTYKDIAHPINSDFRDHLEGLILEKYNVELKMVKAGFPISQTTDADFDAPTYPNVVASRENSSHEKQPDFEAGIAPQVEKRED